MAATGQRRATVTSADGRLLGLLCLKASRTGFCSDQDVCARTLGEAGPSPFRQGWWGVATPQPQWGTGACGTTSAPGWELCMASRVPHSR
jgi:hypothetical protein